MDHQDGQEFEHVLRLPRDSTSSPVQFEMRTEADGLIVESGAARFVRVSGCASGKPPSLQLVPSAGEAGTDLIEYGVDRRALDRATRGADGAADCDTVARLASDVTWWLEVDARTAGDVDVDLGDLDVIVFGLSSQAGRNRVVLSDGRGGDAVKESDLTFRDGADTTIVLPRSRGVRLSGAAHWRRAPRGAEYDRYSHEWFLGGARTHGESRVVFSIESSSGEVVSQGAEVDLDAFQFATVE